MTAPDCVEGPACRAILTTPPHRAGLRRALSAALDWWVVPMRVVGVRLRANVDGSEPRWVGLSGLSWAFASGEDPSRGNGAPASG